MCLNRLVSFDFLQTKYLNKLNVTDCSSVPPTDAATVSHDTNRAEILRCKYFKVLVLVRASRHIDVSQVAVCTDSTVLLNITSSFVQN